MPVNLTNDALFCIISYIDSPQNFLNCSLVCVKWSRVCKKLKLKKAKEFSTHIKQRFVKQGFGNQCIAEYWYLPNSCLHGDYITSTLDQNGNVVETHKTTYSFGSLLNTL